MENKDTLSKVLAAAGTGLVWLPLLAPFLFGLLSLAADGIFRFDYLMPAELFLLALSGGALLVWAALRTGAHRALVAGGLGAAVVLLLGGQWLAVVTGLAHGDTAVGGWQWYLVIGFLILYTLAVLALGVGGLLLLRDLFRPSSGSVHA